MKETSTLSGPFEPTNEPYSVAKLAGLTMCQSYNRQYGTRFLTVIPATLYGPNDNFDPASSHVLSALLKRFSRPSGVSAAARVEKRPSARTR